MQRTRNRGERSIKSRGHASRRSILRTARATLRHVRFSAGLSSGKIEISPQFSVSQRRELIHWITRLPESFHTCLPNVKIAVADHLYTAGHSIFINEIPEQECRSRESTHAVSFIPERYIVLSASLFRRRIELGRILYHELCHFIWPRLGNPRRQRFQALLSRELRERVRGELGYSSEYRKQNLISRRDAAPARSVKRKKMLDYICESFCDTGSFVLLGRERRKHHSEYSLSLTARKRRSLLWYELVIRDQKPRCPTLS